MLNQASPPCAAGRVDSGPEKSLRMMVYGRISVSVNKMNMESNKKRINGEADGPAVNIVPEPQAGRRKNPDIFDFDEPTYVSPLGKIDPILDAKLDAFDDNDNDLVVRRLKRRIANDYDKYSKDKTDETWRQIVEIRKLTSTNGDNAEQQLLTKTPETIRALSEQLHKFTQIIEVADDAYRKNLAWNLEPVMVPFVVAYDEQIFDDVTVDKIVEYARQAVEDQYSASNVGQAIEIIGKSADPNCLAVYLDYYYELEADPSNDLGNCSTRSGLLMRYFASHGIDETRVRGFRQNVFPLIDQQDPEVERLDRGNSWPMEFGGFALSDYRIHCLVSEVNPKNVRDLIQAYREIPTSDFAKFEQNRKDAAELMYTLWEGRDWIHDEVPGVHAVLSAMLDYYKTRNDENVHDEKKAAILRAIDKVPTNYQGIIGDYCFDLENYEKPVNKRIGETYSASARSDETEPAIDVLRRLVENTRQTNLEKPHTDDDKLNSLLEQLWVSPNEHTGKVHVSWRQVGNLVAYTNELLQSRQGEIGLRPSMVQALAYIDKMATYAMRGVSDKDWRELPFDPHFKEIVKFRDLTSSADPFSEHSFEAFWQNFIRIPNWPDGVEDAYKKLSQRILVQAGKMAQRYNSNKYTAYMTDSLWSGNLNHELIGLTDTRKSFKRYEGLS